MKYKNEDHNALLILAALVLMWGVKTYIEHRQRLNELPVEAFQIEE